MLTHQIQYDLRYPSFDWLNKAGIVPSNTTTYTLAQIEEALKVGSGAVPFVSALQYNRINCIERMN